MFIRSDKISEYLQWIYDIDQFIKLRRRRESAWVKSSTRENWTKGNARKPVKFGLKKLLKIRSQKITFSLATFLNRAMKRLFGDMSSLSTGFVRLQHLDWLYDKATRNSVQKFSGSPASPISRAKKIDTKLTINRNEAWKRESTTLATYRGTHNTPPPSPPKKKPPTPDMRNFKKQILRWAANTVGVCALDQG